MELIDQQEICQILSHRPPFLFVDGIIDLEPGIRGKGHKRWTHSEAVALTATDISNGLYDDNKKIIIPPSLVLEAMAQVGAIVVLSQVKSDSDVITYLTQIKNFSITQIIRPGDELVIEAEITSQKGNMGMRKCKAWKNSEQVATAEIGYFLREG